MNVYLPTNTKGHRASGKMHTKLACILSMDIPYIYVSEEEAREKYKAEGFCLKCQKKKSRKGAQ